MPAITGYRPKRHRWGCCFLVELDGEPWAEIPDEMMVKRRLTRGQELSSSEAAEIFREAHALIARLRLAHYLAGRLRTREQARLYALRKLEVAEDEAAALADWAVERGLIDDRVFAQAKARQVKRLGKSGPRQASAKLRGAGVDRETAAEAIQAAALTDREGQLQSCLALLAGRAKRWSDLEPLQRKRRASAFLARRGFESDPIRQALESAERSGMFQRSEESE
jgi:regulatory protein